MRCIKISVLHQYVNNIKYSCHISSLAKKQLGGHVSQPGYLGMGQVGCQQEILMFHLRWAPFIRVLAGVSRVHFLGSWVCKTILRKVARSPASVFPFMLLFCRQPTPLEFPSNFAFDPQPYQGHFQSTLATLQDLVDEA